MTRKDFVLIAGTIKDWRTFGENFSTNATRSALADEIARRMADSLASTNSRFKRERFLTACGVED